MISVLCPTRGRVQLCKRMIDSARDTGTNNNEILIYVDDDDIDRHQYIVQAGADDCITGPSQRVGKSWNVLARAAKGDYLMMGNDDLVYKTDGWDRFNEITGLPDDDIFVAWFNDGSGKSAGHCAFPIVSRKWYETLGYFTPELFHFLWHDTWIYDIGKLLHRCIYIKDILVEHRHFAFKKAEYDKTYRRHRIGQTNAQRRKDDEETFKFTRDKRKSDALILSLVMDE